jgi:thiol-disulfide isomerase/thioredoxin
VPFVFKGRLNQPADRSEVAMRDSVFGGAAAWHAAAVAGAICLGATFPRVQPGRADEVAAREQSVPSLERSDYYEGDGLADVPGPVREALEAWINAEFALERAATPETFATGFVDALVAGGLSEEDAVRTVAAFAAIGQPLSFADRSRVRAALAERLPRLALADSLSAPEKRPDAALPPGGVVVECWGPNDPASLSSQRYVRKDPTWLPRDGFEYPVEFTVAVQGFSVGTPGVTGEDDTLRIDAHFALYAVSRAGERERLTGASLTFTEPAHVPNARATDLPWTLLYVPKSVLSLQDESRLTIEARYEVTHHAPGVKAENRAAVVGTVRHVVVPRRAPGDADGVVDHFDVVPLGPDDEELPCPEVTSWRTATNLGAFVLGRKPFWQDRLRHQREQERKRLALVGRDLDAVPLLHGPDAMAGELTLAADRTHLLLFGATWCGPCHALAPAVDELVGALAAREDAPIVHRLAIDDDLDVFAAALEAYPSGVCTDAFEEDLLVDGVPRYYLVRGGKVVEHGVVDEDRIATWRAMYAP